MNLRGFASFDYVSSWLLQDSVTAVRLLHELGLDRRLSVTDEQLRQLRPE